MPVDTSVIMGYRPIELQNPLAAYGQIAQLQNAQNQNALAQYQLSSAQRKDEDYNRLRGVLGGFGADTPIEQKVNALMGAGFTDEANKVAESHHKAMKDKRDAESSAFTLAKNRHDAYQSGLQGLLNKPDLTKQDVVATAEQMVGSGLLPARFIAQAAGLPDDPVALRAAIKQDVTARLTPEQMFTVFAQKPTEVSTGARKFMRDTGPNSPTYGQEIPGTSVAMEQTPDSKATIAGANERARLSRVQAQSHFDANNIGDLAPDTLDMAAQTYLQTGALPPLGNGPAAAKLKKAILEKATGISMGGGKTAEQAAADVRAGKADTAAVAKSVKDFATGTQGRQVNAFNTAIDHLDTMTKLSDALVNGDLKAINALGNVIARQTDQPPPTNFDAAKQIVTAEVIKAVVASGGGVTERQEAERNFAAANGPKQLKGVIETYKNLLGGQLKSLNLQYENTTGRKDFAKKLTPAAQSELSRLRGESPVPAAAGKWEIVK